MFVCLYIFMVFDRRYICHYNVADSKWVVSDYTTIGLSAVYRIWTARANTKFNDGQRNDASTLAACQTACVSNPQCSGVDWNATAAENQRCWLSGPWSGRRNNGGARGVIHYDLERNCPSKTAIINFWTFLNLQNCKRQPPFNCISAMKWVSDNIWLYSNCLHKLTCLLILQLNLLDCGAQYKPILKYSETRNRNFWEKYSDI